MKFEGETTPDRSELMKKIRSTDTAQEVKLRKALWSKGYRYRKNYRELPGKPDIYLLKHNIVIFIDGEFWHGFNWANKKNRIKANRSFWVNKIEKNINRDKKNNALLKELGYEVMRFWEQELKNDFENCLSAIEKAAKGSCQK
jgi:DNA mismatch endonuclease, patch repair protein